MKRHITKIAALVFLSAMMNCAWADTSLVASDPQKAIVLEKGTQTFQLVLTGNAGTGFAWFLLSYDPRLVEPTGYQWVADHSGKVGAPNQSIWTFTVLPGAYSVPRATTINMAYMRPWLADEPAPTVFHVRLI